LKKSQLTLSLKNISEELFFFLAGEDQYYQYNKSSQKKSDSKNCPAFPNLFPIT
jgi:hypothetical protein